MKCKYCGYILPSGVHFCEECGAAVEEKIDLNKYTQPEMPDMTYTQPNYGYQQQNFGGQPYVSDPYASNQMNMTAGSTKNVNMLDAVKLFFKNYFNFSGRSTRSEFWLPVLFFGVIDIISLTYLLIKFFSSGDSILSLVGLSFVKVFLSVFMFNMFLIIPFCSLLVRRLHDTDKSGLWLLSALFPPIGFFLLLLFTLLPSGKANKYGPVSDSEQYTNDPNHITMI